MAHPCTHTRPVKLTRHDSGRSPEPRKQRSFEQFELFGAVKAIGLVAAVSATLFLAGCSGFDTLPPCEEWQDPNFDRCVDDPFPVHEMGRG